MSPFRRKPSDIPVPDEAWAVAEGEHEGKPLIVRYNQGVPAARDRRGWSVRVGVAVPLLAADERGLPGESDLPALRRIEDVLAGALSASGGILAVVLTTGGMREFMSYVKSESDADAIVAAAQGAGGDYDVQAYRAPDPDWAGYAGFVA